MRQEAYQDRLLGRSLIAVVAMLTGGLIGGTLILYGHGVYSRLVAFIVLVIVAVKILTSGVSNPTWVDVDP